MKRVIAYAFSNTHRLPISWHFAKAGDAGGNTHGLKVKDVYLMLLARQIPTPSLNDFDAAMPSAVFLSSSAYRLML